MTIGVLLKPSGRPETIKILPNRSQGSLEVFESAPKTLEAQVNALDENSRSTVIH